MIEDVKIPTREELREHLVRARISGNVGTPRESNLANLSLMSERDPLYLFGLEPAGTWSEAEVLALMAKRCGINPNPNYRHGQDRIDPDRTIGRLEAMAARIGEAARRRERVIVATGHPQGLYAVHVHVVAALRAAGAPVLHPADGWAHDVDTRRGSEVRRIRYVSDVAVLEAAGALRHTHSPRPMRAMLAALAEAGEPPPDLVVADHGWAGAAGQAGIDSVGFADCNDPALFVGEAEGKVSVCVPLDDNVPMHLYDPLTAYLLDRSGLPLP